MVKNREKVQCSLSNRSRDTNYLVKKQNKMGLYKAFPNTYPTALFSCCDVLNLRILQSYYETHCKLYLLRYALYHSTLLEFSERR